MQIVRFRFLAFLYLVGRRASFSSILRYLRDKLWCRPFCEFVVIS